MPNDDLKFEFVLESPNQHVTNKEIFEAIFKYLEKLMKIGVNKKRNFETLTPEEQFCFNLKGQQYQIRINFVKDYLFGVTVSMAKYNLPFQLPLDPKVN